MQNRQIKRALEQAVEIKRENPAQKYKIVGKIGKGAFGTIFEVQRLSDDKHFALKFTMPKSRAERQTIINECSLMAYLDCDQLLRCEEVYDYQDRLWVFLELMESDLTKIVVAKNGDFSLEFIKYTLYRVAQGVRRMHQHNILHRDLKSDNILCNSTGEIKVSDLGFSVFLSE